MDISHIEIRSMTLSDLESIQDVLTKDFDDFWNFDIFREELAHTNSSYLVMCYENQVIGFAGFKKILEEAEIMNIVIAKAYRQKGLSRLLLNALLEYAQDLGCISVYLEVNSTNVVAISLYQSCGFCQTGLRKKYYHGKDDAMIMHRYL